MPLSRASPNSAWSGRAVCLQIRDELAGAFASMKQQPSAREFYLESWDGKKHIVERVDDDRSIVVPNLLLGVIGGFQPDRLARAFAGDEDGLYARFCYGWPLTPPYAPLTDEIAEVDPEFQALLTKLIRLPAEDGNGAFEPRIVPLSTAAREEFEGYRRFVDQTKRGVEGREQQGLANWCDSDAVPHYPVPPSNNTCVRAQWEASDFIPHAVLPYAVLPWEGANAKHIIRSRHRCCRSWKERPRSNIAHSKPL
jgi:uncharacterized protein DUF3987